MKILKFYGLINSIYPSILIIVLAVAKASGVNFPIWLIWLLGGQIFLGIVLLSMEEK